MAKQRHNARSLVQVDNDRVAVTQWRFAPGEQTGWHRHAYDYVVIPITSGRLLLESAEGSAGAELQAGKPYFRAAGVEHNVINDGDAELVFVEVELKGGP